VVILYLLYVTAFDLFERGPQYAILDIFTLIASVWIHIQAIRLYLRRSVEGGTAEINRLVSLKAKVGVYIIVLLASFSPIFPPLLFSVKFPFLFAFYLPHTLVWLATLFLKNQRVSAILNSGRS